MGGRGRRPAGSVPGRPGRRERARCRPARQHTATAETSDCPSVDETVTPKRNRQDEGAPGAKAETPFCPRRPGARPAWLASTLSSIRGQRATRRCEEKRQTRQHPSLHAGLRPADAPNKSGSAPRQCVLRLLTALPGSQGLKGPWRELAETPSWSPWPATKRLFSTLTFSRCVSVRGRRVLFRLSRAVLEFCRASPTCCRLRVRPGRWVPCVRSSGSLESEEAVAGGEVTAERREEGLSDAFSVPGAVLHAEEGACRKAEPPPPPPHNRADIVVGKGRQVS